MQTQCAYCGKIFETPSSRRKYCSVSCSDKGHRTPPPSKEDILSLYLEQNLTGPEVAQRVGVSVSMIYKWMGNYGIPREKPLKYYPKTCPICKKDFKTKQHNRIHCSRKCQFESQKGKSPGNKLTIPPQEQLMDQVNQGHTLKELATFFEVSALTIEKWLDHYGLKTQYAQNLAGDRPTPEQLHDLVYVQFLTYQQIADIYQVDFSLVGLWLDKYGIPRPDNTWASRHKGEHPLAGVSPEELAALYQSGQSLHSIGQKFGVSGEPIKDFFKQHGIKINHPGWREPVKTLDGHIVKSEYEQRVDDWLYQHHIPHTYEPKLPLGNSKADFLANGWYIEVWGVYNNEEYKKRKAKKLQWYAANNHPLIEIPYFAFSRNTWIKRLEKCLNPPPITEKYHQASF